MNSPRERGWTRFPAAVACGPCGERGPARRPAVLALSPPKDRGASPWGSWAQMKLFLCVLAGLICW
jgi:hypothetical protein